MNTPKAVPTRVGVLKVVPLDMLAVDVNNFRGQITDDSVAELVESIREQGLLQPLVVRHDAKDEATLRVVAGRRRLRALQLLQKERGKPIAVNVHVISATDAEAAEINIVENLQRVDVHPMDEARGFDWLLHNNGNGVSIENVAIRVGKTPSFVRLRLKLLDLIAPIAKAFADDRITLEAASIFSRRTPKIQNELWKRFEIGRTTARDLTRFVREDARMMAHAAWSLDDAALVPAAGTCAACPKRSGNNPALFPELSAKDDQCTDGDCWTSKLKAHIARLDATQTADKEAPAKERVPLVRVSVENRWMIERDKRDGKLPKETIPADDYVVVGKKRCASAKPAVYVDGDRAGKTVWICRNEKCTEHGIGERARGTAGGPKKQSKAEREKVLREGRQRRHEAQFRLNVMKQLRTKAVARDWMKPSGTIKFARPLARLVAATIGNHDAAYLLPVFGAPAVDSVMNGPSRLEALVDKMPTEDVQAFLALAPFAHDARYEQYHEPDAKRLVELSKALGFDYVASAKKSRADFDASEKARTAKKQSTNQPKGKKGKQ